MQPTSNGTEIPRSAPDRPLRCALLVSDAQGWFFEFLFACPGIELYSFPNDTLGIPIQTNPFALPFVDRPDVVLVSADWVRRLNASSGISPDAVFSRIRSRCNVLVGVDGHDALGLWMPPNGLAQVNLLVKGQGVYRDRALYNYKVGSWYPGADWTGKSNKFAHAYSSADLDKIRLSVPCFLGISPIMRARIRARKLRMSFGQRALRRVGDLASSLESSLLRLLTRPKATAHCLVSLTHISRLDLLISLRKAGITGDMGASSLPSQFAGTSRLDALADDQELDSLRARLLSHDLLRSPLSRYRFKRSLSLHKAVLAPPGYGELTLRHGDALERGRALVCPDLSHVEMMFQFENARNVIFCRPDFADVIATLKAVESGQIDHCSIGARGYADWEAWIADVDGILRRGILNHLHESLG